MRIHGTRWTPAWNSIQQIHKRPLWGRPRWGKRPRWGNIPWKANKPDGQKTTIQRLKNSPAQTNFNNISQWRPKETKTNLVIGTILTKPRPKEMTNQKYINEPFDFNCICRSMVLKLGPSKNPVDLVCNTNQENGTNK